MEGRITPAQIRGARCMLGWSLLDLAKAAGVSVSKVKRMETAGSQTASDDAALVVRTVLERQGMHFLPDAGEGGGLRLSDPAA